MVVCEAIDINKCNQRRRVTTYYLKVNYFQQVLSVIGPSVKAPPHNHFSDLATALCNANAANCCSHLLTVLLFLGLLLRRSIYNSFPCLSIEFTPIREWHGVNDISGTENQIRFILPPARIEIEITRIWLDDSFDILCSLSSWKKIQQRKKARKEYKKDRPNNAATRLFSRMVNTNLKIQWFKTLQGPQKQGCHVNDVKSFF